MLKEPTQTLDGPALSEEVYHLALERIKALIGCTEDSPEERELIDWATIADTYEHSVHNNDNVTAAPALAPAAQQSAQEKDGGEWVMSAEPGEPRHDDEGHEGDHVAPRIEERDRDGDPDSRHEHVEHALSDGVLRAERNEGCG